jgi:hypothetical protein
MIEARKRWQFEIGGFGSVQRNCETADEMYRMIED